MFWTPAPCTPLFQNSGENTETWGTWHSYIEENHIHLVMDGDICWLNTEYKPQHCFRERDHLQSESLLILTLQRVQSALPQRPDSSPPRTQSPFPMWRLELPPPLFFPHSPPPVCARKQDKTDTQADRHTDEMGGEGSGDGGLGRAGMVATQSVADGLAWLDMYTYSCNNI